MIISNLFRKVDSSWLPFFIPFFKTQEGIQMAEYINFHGSRSTLFPKYYDIFKPFENISVDKVKVLLIGTMPPPTPRYTSESYQDVKDKQYEVKSETLVRKMFAKDICPITTKNLVDRNILALNIIPFSSSESFSHIDFLKRDNSVPVEYFYDVSSSRNKKTFTEIISSFFYHLILFLKKEVGGVVILTNSGIKQSNNTKNLHVLVSTPYPVRLYNLKFNESPFNFILGNILEGNRITHHHLIKESLDIVKIKDIPSTVNVFIFDIFSFIKGFDESHLDPLFLDLKDLDSFVDKNSDLKPLQLIINYFVRKHFRNSIPIKW